MSSRINFIQQDQLQNTTTTKSVHQPIHSIFSLLVDEPKSNQSSDCEHDPSNHYNLMKSFYSLEQLKEYSEINYVHSIQYSGKELKQGDLPVYGILNIVSFSFDYILNDGNVIPEGVHTVYFPNEYKLPMNLINLPNSLERMKNIYLNQLSTIGYNQLESIVFSSSFNSKIILSNQQFSKLKELDLGEIWNNDNCVLKQGNLPNGLEILIMAGYDQELSIGVIPSTVTKLFISHPHNYTLLIGSIPSSVKELNISNSNGYLSIPVNSIPDSVVHLTLGSLQVSLENGSLPNSLLYFELTSNLVTDEIGQDILPQSLKELKIYSSNTPLGHNSLPDGLTTLIYDPKPVDVGLINNQKSLPNCPLNVGFFKSSITRLEIGRITTDEYSLTTNIIPNSVKSLKLTSGFNSPIIKDLIPNSITELEIGSTHSKFKIQEGSLPLSITNLIISSTTYNQPIKIGFFHNGLKKLIFTNNSAFNQSLDIVGIFPSTLIHLEFSSNKFKYPIIKSNVLPSSLKNLIVYSGFSKHYTLISQDAIPPLLKIIKPLIK